MLWKVRGLQRQEAADVGYEAIPPRFPTGASHGNPEAYQSVAATHDRRPIYPQRPFENLLSARQWVGTFASWYNDEHRHSAIGFVTPAERHAGLDAGLLRKRIDVYEAAKKNHPERWSGTTRNWLPAGPVHLNPDQHADKNPDQREVTSGLKKAA